MNKQITPAAGVVTPDAVVERPMTIAEETTFCANHPTVPTALRCNKCDRYICLKCAMRTPVGYRCKQCVREQQSVYFNAKLHDDAVAFLVSAAVAAIVIPLSGILLGAFFFYGFYFAFIAGPMAGGILVQVVRTAVGRRRSRYMVYSVLAGIVIGGIVGLGIAQVAAGYALWGNLVMYIFAATTASTVYPMMR